MTFVDLLIQEGYLKTPRIIEAFRAIQREDFVPQELKEYAEVNAPLPIGFGQTISQPLTVVFMLELLEPQPGDRILDVGAGSGWTSALFAYIVSQGADKTDQTDRTDKPDPSINSGQDRTDGKVIAIEIVPELCDFGKQNVGKYNFIEKEIVEFYCGDATKIIEKFGLLDKIHAAAAGKKIPEIWKEHLQIGGRIVAPVESSVWLLIKKSEHQWEEHEYPGFAFVPLITK